MDKGVLDIMNEGFTQEQAEEAMQRFKNPQKALKHLKVIFLCCKRCVNDISPKCDCHN